MFKKRPVNKPRKNQRMNNIDLEDDIQPAYVEVDEADDDIETVEVVGRRNRGNTRVDIFGPNSQIELKAGFAAESSRLDMAAIAAQNRREAQIAQASIVNELDFPLDKNSMNQEAIESPIKDSLKHQDAAVPHSNLFSISTQPQGINTHEIRYNTIDLDSESVSLQEKPSSKRQPAKPVSSMMDEEFKDSLLMPQEQYAKSIKEDLRLRKLEHALDEHRASTKSRFKLTSLPKRRRDHDYGCDGREDSHGSRFSYLPACNADF